MAKLDDVPKPELCEWWEKYVGVDYYRVDHERLIIEYDGKKLLVEGKFRGGQDILWWSVRVDGMTLSVNPKEPIEEVHRRIVRLMRSSRFYYQPQLQHRPRRRRRPAAPQSGKHSLGEQAFAELDNPQLVEVPMPEEGA